MEIYELDPCRDSRWERFLDRHPDASIFHSPQWLEALRRTYAYEPIVYTTSPPGRELENGQPFCLINSWLTGRRLVSLPFSDHTALLFTGTDELECLSQYLQQAARGSCKYVELRPLNDDFGDPAFRESSIFYQHRLSLKGDMESLFDGFHHSCVRRKIRRAIRERLEYTEGNSKRLIQQFHALLLQTQRRHCIPPHPISWLHNLSNCLGENFKIRIASKDGRPIAGIVTLSHKTSVIYKYGGSVAEHHNLGGMSFLFWKTIQESKTLRFRELDMGRSDLDNPGLVKFKEHWGAEKLILRYWRYPEAKLSTSTQWKLKAAKKIFALVPRIALPTAGRLLYRHVG